MSVSTLVVAIAACLVLAGPPAQASSFTSDAASTDWDDSAAWTAGVGFPVAGDNVTITNNRTFDGPEEFGDSANDSTWSAGYLDPDDNVVTHSGNSIMRLTTGLTMGMLSNPKGWSFINEAGSTFSHDVAGTLVLTCGLFNSDQGGFINEGTYRFTAAGTLSMQRSSWFKNIGTLRNDSGGSVTITHAVQESCSFSNAASGVVEAIGAGSIITYVTQRLRDGGGTWRALTNAEIRLNPTLSPGGVWAVDSGTTFHGDEASDGIVAIMGDWSRNLVGIATGNVYLAKYDEFRIASNLTVNLDASGASGGTAAGAIPGTVVWGGAGSIAVEDNTVTIDTPSSINGAALTFRANGSLKNGTAVNASGNTFTHAYAGKMDIHCVGTGGGVRFRNEGLFVLSAADAYVEISFAENVFRNTTGGRVRADTGSGNTARFTATGEFNNQGTIEVLSGELDVASAIEFLQFNSGDLTGGTYEVTGILDLNPAAAGITNIDANATVVLKGSSASFNELSGNLSTVHGTFGMHSGHVYNAASGDLIIDGTLEFGLADSDASETVVITGITNANNITLGGGLVDIVDIGLTVPGTFTLISCSGVSGALTLDDVPDNELLYELVHNAQSVQLDVATPPEGTAILVR